LEPQKKEASFYLFNQGNWFNFATSLQNIPSVHDLTDVSYNAKNEKLYFASFGDGILIWDQQEQFVIIDSNTGGSTLQELGGPSTTYIPDIETDAAGSLWITNYGVPTPLHNLDPDDIWKNYSFSYPNARFPLGIAISSNEDKWIRLRTEGGAEILVFNESTNSTRLLSTETNQGSLPGGQVNKIVQDLEGLMWIGTDRGIAYIMNPFSVLNDEPINAIVPRYENGFLLRGENITSMKVDGGNRKWFGTTTSGLWLFEDSGEALVHHFNIANSPLPSNFIHDIEIDERTGEVFIATDKGLISYRGTATRATKAHQKVKIFPNPVRANFTGQLGISGLSENADVKIINISGKLVRQLYAEGGTAVWDINDERGNRVNSGVYLVVSASADGEETFVGKIAVIE
jgi:streptogramin lyase